MTHCTSYVVDHRKGGRKILSESDTRTENGKDAEGKGDVRGHRDGRTVDIAVPEAKRKKSPTGRTIPPIAPIIGKQA